MATPTIGATNRRSDVSADARSHEQGFRYRPELDGLRAVAVYLVVAFHARLGWFSGGFIGYRQANSVRFIRTDGPERFLR